MPDVVSEYIVSCYDGYTGSHKEQKFGEFKDARGLASAMKNNPNFRDVVVTQVTTTIIPEQDWYYDTDTKGYNDRV